jgi:hypothetical protein
LLAVYLNGITLQSWVLWVFRMLVVIWRDYVVVLKDVVVLSVRPLQYFVLDSGPADQEITKFERKKSCFWGLFRFLFRSEMNIFLGKGWKRVISFSMFLEKEIKNFWDSKSDILWLPMLFEKGGYKLQTDCHITSYMHCR